METNNNNTELKIPTFDEIFIKQTDPLYGGEDKILRFSSTPAATGLNTVNRLFAIAASDPNYTDYLTINQLYNISYISSEVKYYSLKNYIVSMILNNFFVAIDNIPFINKVGYMKFSNIKIMAQKEFNINESFDYILHQLFTASDIRKVMFAGSKTNKHYTYEEDVNMTNFVKTIAISNDFFISLIYSIFAKLIEEDVNFVFFVSNRFYNDPSYNKMIIDITNSDAILNMAIDNPAMLKMAAANAIKFMMSNAVQELLNNFLAKEIGQLFDTEIDSNKCIFKGLAEIAEMENNKEAKVKEENDKSLNIGFF